MPRTEEQTRLQVEQDAAIAQALGDPVRIQILRALVAATEPLTLAALAAKSGLDAATIDAHLPLLSTSGAITRAQDAGAAYRLAQTPTARTLRAMLEAMTPDVSAPYVVGATLEAILDQLASGVALYDASGRMVRLNPAGERITRQPVRAGETMGDRLIRYHLRDVSGAPMPVADSPSGRALRGAVVSQMECIIDGQHGQDTWLRCSAAPLKDEHGAIQGAAVIFDDITEQRMLSREEARQRSLAEAMIEHTFSGMAVFDVSDAFRCALHNDNFLRLMGSDFLARGSIVGMSLDELFPDNVRAPVRKIFEEVQATGEPYVNNEFSVALAPDARRRWYRLRLTPVRDESGKVTGLLMVAFEITELVTAREASRRHARELSAVIEAMPEAVMLADSEGHVALSNSAAQQILGQPMPLNVSVIRYSETFHSFTPDGRRLDTRELPLMRALQGETVIAEEVSYQRPDGARIDLLTSAAPVDLDDSGHITGAVSIFQDITSIKALERQRDDFLGIAAHELRTPLATILATLQAFQRRLRNNPGDQAIPADALTSGVERMYRQAQRLNKLVSDLLDSTRIRTGTLIYELEPSDLVGVVRDAVAGQIAANPGRTITLTVPKHPVIVMGDAFRLSQVVDNLVANALKYSAEALPVTVSLKVADGMGRLRVADKGVGIPPENVAQLFDRFYRVPGIDVQSGAGVGLGLGLNITRSVVERHGGHIEVQSSPGKGSTFVVTMPLLADADQHET
jgi:PAS domain S-box-containing protein